MMSIAAATGSAWTECPTMNGDRGFTYLAVLALVVILSISMMAAQTYWSTIMKREREKELLFRGGQIRSAIESYCKSSPGAYGSSFPRRLEDLIRDPRFPGVKRHLRRIYKDPMTEHGKWGLVLESSGGIKGVFSQSTEQPLKRGKFTGENEKFENKKGYKEWKFVYENRQKGTS